MAYGGTIAQTADVRENFGDAGTVFHLEGAFFLWFLIGIKRPIIDAGELVVIRPWRLLLLWRIPARTGDTHLVPFRDSCLVIGFLVWVYSSVLYLYLKGFSTLVSIDVVIIRGSFVIHVFFFITVLVVKVILKPRFYFLWVFLNITTINCL